MYKINTYIFLNQKFFILIKWYGMQFIDESNFPENLKVFFDCLLEEKISNSKYLAFGVGIH